MFARFKYASLGLLKHKLCFKEGLSYWACGLYYKRVTIVIDAPSVISK